MTKIRRQPLVGRTWAPILLLFAVLGGCGQRDDADRGDRALAATTPDELVARGRSLLERGETERAAAEIGKAIGRDPSHVAARKLLAELYVGRGLDDAAEVEYSLLLALGEDQQAHSGLASLAISSGRHEDAVFHLEQVLELAPKDADTLTNLGIVQTKQGRYQAALGSFERALEVRPESLDALHNVGYALRMVGRPEDAVETLTKVLERDPAKPGTIYELGLSYAATDRMEEARATLERVLEIVPQHHGARRALQGLDGS